jgi:MFS family permease
MFRRIIHRIFSGRHYWRLVSFDEIAELYTSRLLTVFAINIVNLFAAVYLYRLGNSIEFIVLLYGILYALKVPYSILVAKYTAYFGPKHGILLANIIRIPSLVAFALVPEYGVWAIVAFGVFQQLSSALYDLCYLTDFSKVKSTVHAGKEIGTMQIIEKAAKVLSPLVGGAIASMYSPRVTIIIACILFIMSAWPLFKTIEPTKTRNRLRLVGFPWRLALRSLVSQSVVGFDFVASGMAWTLFVTIFVFAGLGEGTYAALGGLASLGVLISIVAAWTFGQVVDRHKGGILLVVGAIANTVIHLFRPFVTTPAGVMGVNIANESATSAYALPFTRVMFDVADSSGFRITYLMFIEMAVNFGAALACFVMVACIHWFGAQGGLMAFFVVAAVYELLLLISRRAAK